MPRIPRTAHFVFGLRPQAEPFHLVHYLAIASCAEVLAPDAIHLHCHELPYGFYWDLARPLVELHRVEPVTAVTDFPYDDPIVRHYSYAHQADFVRLDVLADHGGVYADIDTLFVAPPPPALWDAPCVIGREADVLDPRTGRTRGSLSNALVMAEPGARFVERWRAEIGDALDGSWSAHSCFLAADLARRRPDEVLVAPERTFHAFPPSPDGLRRLLVDHETDLTGIVSVHLAAHLWWDEDRRDFSAVHARQIDEAWIRGGTSTYAAAAQRFLPEHGCF
jgi:Glycosyltransferase sugar-binding region containing DXD motif